MWGLLIVQVYKRLEDMDTTTWCTFNSHNVLLNRMTIKKMYKQWVCECVFSSRQCLSTIQYYNYNYRYHNNTLQYCSFHTNVWPRYMYIHVSICIMFNYLPLLSQHQFRHPRHSVTSSSADKNKTKSTSQAKHWWRHVRRLEPNYICISLKLVHATLLPHN